MKGSVARNRRKDRLEHDGVPRSAGQRCPDRLTRVFSTYPDLEAVTLFGSHAVGSATRRSDIDLATRGIRDPHPLGRLVLDLEDLDLPQACDVKALEAIRYPPLKRHIAQVGVTIYTRPAPHT